MDGLCPEGVGIPDSGYRRRAMFRNILLGFSETLVGATPSPGRPVLTALANTPAAWLFKIRLPSLNGTWKVERFANCKGIFMAVTNNIREIWEQRGIYQDDLAAAIGYSTKTVGRIERGDSTPSAEFMLRISKYFNMLVEDVFHVED